MIKRSNPIDKNKQELAKELISIKDKQIAFKEKSIPQLLKLKSKLIDLKVNGKETTWNQLKLRFSIIQLMSKLEDNGIDTKDLEKLNEQSVKEVSKLKEDLETKSKASVLVRSNEQLIDRLLVLINNAVIKFKNEIKEWKSKKKTHLKTFKIGKK